MAAGRGLSWVRGKPRLNGEELWFAHRVALSGDGNLKRRGAFTQRHLPRQVATARRQG